MSMFGSIRGSAYLVWCPDRGATREYARCIVSCNPKSAATDWAEWEDASSADYTIVGGTDIEVVVAEDREGSAEWRFTVSGESVPCYRARKAA